MSNVLEQAEDALRQNNWCLLHQCLQQVFIDRTAKELSDSTLKRALELAIAVLEAGDFQERWDVAKLIPAFGDRAIAPLIDLLQDDAADAEAQWFATRMLGSYSQPDSVMALVKLLQTTANEDLSSMAAEALAQMGTPAIAALTALLIDSDTRAFAVRSLAQIRRAETIDPLLTVVDDPQATVRAIAIEALSSFYDPRVPSVLVRALSDPAALVRQEAVVGLGMRSELAEAMNLVALLTDRLLDVDLEVCQKTAMALGRMSTQAAAANLFQALNAAQTSTPLRLSIVRALGWMETAIALDLLRQTLLCLEPTTLLRPVHQEIITVLGRCTEPDLQRQAAQLLIALLTSGHALTADPAVRRAIATGLGALKQQNALEALMELLADEEISVRLHAIAALKALDATTAHQRLTSLVNHADVPEALKQGAAIALQEW